MSDLIELKEVVYNVRARNGVWCTHPYYNHPWGCPNFPKCIKKYTDFSVVADQYKWYAVTESFDLKSHAKMMKEKLPHWTERQCRNPLYWQGSVRKRLLNKALAVGGNVVLTIPEACGVNVFETMSKVGIILERKPDTVIKVMLVGFSLDPIPGRTYDGRSKFITVG